MNTTTPTPPAGTSGRRLVILLVLFALVLAVLTLIVNRPALDGPTPNTPFRPPTEPSR